MAKPGHDIISVNDLLSGAKSYVVPRYQRGYAWDETNFKELWEDIRGKCLEGQDLFLGSIILSRTPIEIAKQPMEVVDGQQRMITFTILLRAMHDRLSKEPKQERFTRELYRLIAVNEGTKYKLTLGTEDEDFFLRFIKKQVRESNLRGLRKSHKNIRRAYEYFSERIDEMSNNTRWGSAVDFLDALLEALKEHTQLLEIMVTDEFDAYAIFESINAKRVDLTPAELIKNYVFQAVSNSQTDLDKVEQDWDDAVDKLNLPGKEIAITTYIRHSWIAREKDVREKELYRAIKEKYKDSTADIPNFVSDLAQYASFYASMNYPEANSKTDNGIDVSQIEGINRFSFKQTYPLILSAIIASISQDKFDELMQTLQSVILRRSVRGSNPNELEEVLSRCARQMNTKGEKALPYIKDELRKLTPNDESVRQDLSTTSYTPNVKVILEEYEMKFSTGEKMLKNPTVEHIMPKNPANNNLDEWNVNLEGHEHWLIMLVTSLCLEDR